MSQETAAEESTGLSEVERVVDVFVAPSRTFTDILRSTRWWLPLLLMVIFITAGSYVVDQRVGFERVAENAVHQSPKLEERLGQLTAEQRAAQIKGMAKGYRFSSYAAPVLVLAFVGVAALLYWASFNFGLGTRTTYAQMFALWMYASMPRLISGVLSILTILFGADADGYDMRNPVGTNPAYYLPEASQGVRAFLSFFDVIGLWVLVLLVIGSAIIAGVSRGKAAAVVMGWWVVGMLVAVGMTVAFN